MSGRALTTMILGKSLRPKSPLYSHRLHGSPCREALGLQRHVACRIHPCAVRPCGVELARNVAVYRDVVLAREVLRRGYLRNRSPGSRA